MLRILVYNPAAATSGAEQILHDFYKKVSNYNNDNNDIEWFFLISNNILEESKNINILNYAFIKKSLKNRILFETIYLKKLTKELDIDFVISLQNAVPLCTRLPSALLIQQSLIFTDYKPRTLKGKVKFPILKFSIINSIRKAKVVLVQNNSMRNHIKKVDQSKYICIYKPDTFNLHKKFDPSIDENFSRFVYPALGVEEYKNHKEILEACKLLESQKIRYEVYFTFKGNENENANEIYKEAKDYNLNIKFLGYLNKDDLYSYYEKSILLFPSKYETVGLPLLEAKSAHSPIFALNTEYLNETIEDYERLFIFNDHRELFELMKNALTLKNNVVKDVRPKKNNNNNLIDDLIKKLKNEVI